MFYCASGNTHSNPFFRIGFKDLLTRLGREKNKKSYPDFSGIWISMPLFVVVAVLK